MTAWSGYLEQRLTDYFSSVDHGDYPSWQQAINALPFIEPSSVVLDSKTVSVGAAADINEDDRERIIKTLKLLSPWRKGPFNLFGIEIDAEWRSDMKWSRLEQYIEPLTGRLVLDVGCGNGYYGWRMLGQGAELVVGLDPTLLFIMQFHLFKRYIPESNLTLLPFGIAAAGDYPLNFDTVFSMGVLYHRRDPVEHLFQLKDCLKRGGELVLESLVIDANDIDLLKPERRYAKMNNARFIPSTRVLVRWLEQVGFSDISVIDVTRTSCDEQRVTEWSGSQSLSDFLDKDDDTKTIEGYPAPVRAIVLAEK